MKKYVTNWDIREYMKDHGVTQTQLSMQIGKVQSRISAMLNEEMSEKEKEEFIRHIVAIVEARKTQCLEETPEEVEKTEEPAHEVVTTATKFQLGDRVKVATRHSILGTISDIWRSVVQDRPLYAVVLENGSKGMYAENQLEPAPVPITYSWEAHIDGNVAVVTMNATQGDKTWVHSRGHAHILHDGEVGMAQAVSYAARRMFETLDKKQPNQIYFKGDK